MRWEYYDWLPVMLLALTIFFTWLSCWKVEYLKDDTGDGILDFYTRLSNKYVRFSIFFLGSILLRHIAFCPFNNHCDLPNSIR